MILRFKPESEAEKAVKNLIVNRDKTLEYAKDIVEKATGIRPVAFGYHFFFSISYSWNCNDTAFSSSAPDEIEGMKLIKVDSDYKHFEPNKRTKKGKEISKAFHNEQCELRIDSESLNEYGIFTEKDMRYTDWGIGEDEKGVWMAISTSAFGWLKPHPDVFLETEIKTVK